MHQPISPVAALPIAYTLTILLMESILLVLLLLIIFTLLTLRKNTTKGRGSPPGPWRLPLIGNIHNLIGSLPHNRLRNLSKKYGPVMQLQIGEVSTVIISSPEVAKEVLKTHERNFVERPRLLVGDVVFYDRNDIGLASYGDNWRQMRKVCILKLLGAERVRSFKSIREEEVSSFIRAIYSKADQPINLTKMVFDLSNSIASRAIMGGKCRDQEAFGPIIERVTEAMGSLNLADAFPSSRLLYMFDKMRSRLGKLHEEADKILENIVNECRVAKEVTKSSDKENEEKDNLLDVLLNLYNPATANNVKATILEMFVGGSGPSTGFLEWAMSELLKNPRVMQKVQEEVRQFFSHTSNIDETSLQNLKYLKLIIKEILRLHPTAPIIPRECNNTCKINGYVIKTGTKVMINMSAIGRDSDYWIEAEKFYPERFLESSIDYRGNNFELIPFGAGKRMCPGLLFATTNIELILAHLLYHFDWKLPNGAALEDLDMDEVFGGTVRRKHHLNLIPKPYASVSLVIK